MELMTKFSKLFDKNNKPVEALIMEDTFIIIIIHRQDSFFLKNRCTDGVKLLLSVIVPYNT